MEVEGDPLRLSAKEMQLLLTLAEKPRRMFTRDESSRKVWSGVERTGPEDEPRTGLTRASHGQEVPGRWVDGPVENVWGCAVTD